MRGNLLAVILGVGAALLVACDGPIGGGTTDTAGATSTEVAPEGGGVQLPPTDELPATDLSQHTVPLTDIHFPGHGRPCR